MVLAPSSHLFMTNGTTKNVVCGEALVASQLRYMRSSSSVEDVKTGNLSMFQSGLQNN